MVAIRLHFPLKRDHYSDLILKKYTEMKVEFSDQNQK